MEKDFVNEKRDDMEDLIVYLENAIEEDYQTELLYCDEQEQFETADLIKQNNEIKLENIRDLVYWPLNMQIKFYQMVDYIFSKVTASYMRMRLILTYGMILNKSDNNIETLMNEQSFLLAAGMMNIGFDNYDFIERVLSVPIVLDSIINKTQDMNARLEIIESIIEKTESDSLQFYEEENATKNIADALIIINTYQLEKRR